MSVVVLLQVREAKRILEEEDVLGEPYTAHANYWESTGSGDLIALL